MKLTDNWCIKGGQLFHNFILQLERKHGVTINVVGNYPDAYYSLSADNLFDWNYHKQGPPNNRTLITFEEFLQIVNNEGHLNNNYEIY